jgi:tricorn protease-like protein
MNHRRRLLLAIAATLLGGYASAADAQAPTPDSAKKKDLPLVATRTISLDTDEGSWLSLDVSADGKTVVFDLLGDIYTVPLAGGTATQLTRGLAFDGQPRFSPDGKRIVFTSDRDGAENVWVMNPTERSRDRSRS